MVFECAKCGTVYDDLDRTTVCPHELLMSMDDLRQKDLGLSLVGKRVKFHGDLPQPPDGYEIMSVGWNGMVGLRGMVGEFAPHLFEVVG